MSSEEVKDEIGSVLAKLRWLGTQPSPNLHEHILDMTAKLTKAQRRETILKKFCHYQFEDIHYQYRNLTDQEKALCTEQEFNELMYWLRRGK